MTQTQLTQQQKIELGQSYNLAHNQLMQNGIKNVKNYESMLKFLTKKIYKIKQEINQEIIEDNKPKEQEMILNWSDIQWTKKTW